MELPTIEKGDVIATRDGREIRVLSVYRPAGTILRVEGVDTANPSPMREPVFAKDIARILRKRPQPAGVNPQDPALLPEAKTPVQKEKTPEAVKKDVAERERHRTTSAENKEKAEKGGK